MKCKTSFFILVSLLIAAILTPLFAIAGGPSEDAIKRGVEALQNGNEESAVANFSEAVRLDPKSPNAFIARALAFGLKDEWDNALADCTEAIRLDPQNAFLGYFCRGDVHMKKHDWDKAIADYTKAIQLNPNNAGMYNSRGTAYEKKGEKSKAEADFEEAKRLTVKPQVAKDAKWQVTKKPSAMQPAPRKKIYVPQGLDNQEAMQSRARHDQLMQEARQDRRAEEERWVKQWEAEKDRRSRERIAAKEAEARRRESQTPQRVIVIDRSW